MGHKAVIPVRLSGDKIPEGDEPRRLHHSGDPLLTVGIAAGACRRREQPDRKAETDETKAMRSRGHGKGDPLWPVVPWRLATDVLAASIAAKLPMSP